MRQLSTLVCEQSLRSRDDRHRQDAALSALRHQVALLTEQMEQCRQALHRSAALDVHDRLSGRLADLQSVLNRKADLIDLDRKANLSDLQSLMALVLSGDRVLLGARPLK